ncbi:MAG: hypothetical protein VW311_02720, partial [Gammaproteobacteria bacterium]
MPFIFSPEFLRSSLPDRYQPPDRQDSHRSKYRQGGNQTRLVHEELGQAHPDRKGAEADGNASRKGEKSTLNQI